MLPCTKGRFKFKTWQALMPPSQLARGCAQGGLHPAHQPLAVQSEKLFIYCSGGVVVAPATPHEGVRYTTPPSKILPCHGGSLGPCLTWQHPGCKHPGTSPLGARAGATQVLQEMRKAAVKLPPVGGQGQVHGAPLMVTMVPLVMLHEVAIVTPLPPSD